MNYAREKLRLGVASLARSTEPRPQDRLVAAFIDELGRVDTGELPSHLRDQWDGIMNRMTAVPSHKEGSFRASTAQMEDGAAWELISEIVWLVFDVEEASPPRHY